MSLVFLAAMGAVVVGFVLHPIFSREEVAPEHLDETRREMGRLTDQKNRLLSTIKDLDFEYRAGKLSDADYQRVRADDLSRLAQLMARLEELAAGQKPLPTEEVRCLSCQQTNPPKAKFCISCGKPIEIPVQCPRCGAELPEKARFCADCGAPVQSAAVQNE